jgi:hypothetical protein
MHRPAREVIQLTGMRLSDTRSRQASQTSRYGEKRLWLQNMYPNVPRSEYRRCALSASGSKPLTSCKGLGKSSYYMGEKSISYALPRAVSSF